ncbi:MAG TPA: helix-turn-helix transcriptional regulator [Lentimicrobium sp.]|nr:helix-turn-helix transcriptional regulator [Lentimicrobium sp.]
MNNRIALVLKTKNMSSAQLADELGVQRSGISHILNGRNKPSLDFILRIIKKYPDISVNWLLFGDGPMMNPYLVQSTGEMNVKASTQKSMLELFNDPVDETGNKYTPEPLETNRITSIYSENQLHTPFIEEDQKEQQKKSETIKEEITLNNEKPTAAEDWIRVKESGVTSDPSGLEKRNTTQTRSAKIERIIIFYTDRSFKEYYPD